MSWQNCRNCRVYRCVYIEPGRAPVQFQRLRLLSINNERGSKYIRQFRVWQSGGTLDPLQGRGGWEGGRGPGVKAGSGSHLCADSAPPRLPVPSPPRPTFSHYQSTERSLPSSPFFYMRWEKCPVSCRRFPHQGWGSLEDFSRHL